MDNAPIISIITPSFNRAKELKFLYKSLKQQSIDLRLFEFIISDDGSTDNTREMVIEWEKKSDILIKFITQKNQGPGAARNNGLKIASGELILFIDSDCEAHPDWIKNIFKEYQENSFDAFGGPDSAKEDFTALQKAIDFSMTSFFTTGGMRGHSENMIAKFFPRTHNMGIKKSVYDKIGGFGSLRHGQDIEFSNRIRKSGFIIKFLINVVVYHRRRATIKQFFKQVYNWGVARINLGMIDSSMLEIIHFIPSIATLSLIFLLCIFIYFNFPIHLFLLFFLVPLLSLSGYGTYVKNDPRVFLFLLVVIPLQILGYGIGFLQAFIRRFILDEEEIVGFKKNYYK